FHQRIKNSFKQIGIRKSCDIPNIPNLFKAEVAKAYLMASEFTTAVALEYVICIHKESKGIIYYMAAPGIEVDPSFLESFRKSIESEEIKLPGTVGDIAQVSVKEKYAVIRSGRTEYVAVILNKTPDRLVREALHSFGIKFGSRWGSDLKSLYSELNGDVSIFKRRTPTTGNVDDLAEECFHFSLAMPHRVETTLEKLKGLTKTVWTLAEQLARGKQYILLGDLLAACKKKTNESESAISVEIFGLIRKAVLVPFKEKEVANISLGL
ncbi:MAG: hypothetical protein RBG13Loki_3832, partial [Promethearchaeota archaeon CR_4]